jgi:hypothetical protein
MKNWNARLKKFLKYHTQILLGNFDAKVGREDNFKHKLKMTVYTK